MSDTKISALPAGAPAQSGDLIPIARSGANYSITPANILSYGGTISAAAGTVAAPGFYLSTDTGTGFYRIGANNAGWAVSGSKVLDIASTGLGVTGTVTASGGATASTVNFGPAGIQSPGTVNNTNQISYGGTDGKWGLGVVESAATGTVRGLSIYYASQAPNDTGNQFFFCADSSASRIIGLSNGGISNYSANNTNLSDLRVKKDIKPAGNYLDKICAIPVKTFLYKDQTDTDLNLGVIAQDVEAVAPELIDKNGFGELPADGIPLKAVYQTDLQYALMKAIQELAAKVSLLEQQLAAK